MSIFPRPLKQVLGRTIPFALADLIPTFNLGTGTANSTTFLSGDGTWQTPAGGGISDGDKGDITVSSSGTVWTIDNLAVTDAKINDVAWSKVTGEPTTLSGYGISDTKINFDTACSDGNFLYVGDVTQYTDELAQDAVGAMVANSTFVNLAYVDGTPSLTPSLSATGTPSATTFLRGDNTWGTPASTDPAGWTTIVKSANQDVTNSSTLVDDTDLQFSVVSGGVYMIKAEVVMSQNNVTYSYSQQFRVSSGTQTGSGIFHGRGTTNSLNTSLLTIAGASNAATNLNYFGAQSNINHPSFVTFEYAFYASANATFSYQFTGAAVAGVTVRTWKGSLLKYKKIN